MKVELTGIEIKVDTGVLKLTIEEAKDLYMQLRELFGESGKLPQPEAPVIIPYRPPEPASPWTGPQTPVWPYTPTHPWTLPMYNRATITCYGKTTPATDGATP